MGTVRTPRSSWASVRPSSKAAVIAASAVIALGAGGAVMTVRDSASANGTPREADTMPFYADLKISLAPLLAHTVALPAALEQAQRQPVSGEVAALAGGWADDAATARDLVGRLNPPASPVGLPARRVCELGAALYVESARTLERLAGEDRDEARIEAATSGLRLRLLADRLFDAAKRLLNPHWASDTSLILPAEIPDFEEEEPGLLDHDPDTVPTSRWALDHRSHLADALDVLEQTAQFSALADSPDRIPAWSETLRTVGRRLAGPVPATRTAREAGFLFRLALLTQVEALTAAGTATAASDSTFAHAQRLRLVGDELWTLSEDLFEADGVRLEQQALPVAGIDRTILRRGGLFDGRPPPLAPGDRPDAGVPGGLQLPDPSKVFSGR